MYLKKRSEEMLNDQKKSVIMERKKLQVIEKDEKEKPSLVLKTGILYCIRRKTITETCVRMMQTCWLSETLKDEFDSDTTELRSGRNILTELSFSDHSGCLN